MHAALPRPRCSHLACTRQNLLPAPFPTFLVLYLFQFPLADPQSPAAFLCQPRASSSPPPAAIPSPIYPPRQGQVSSVGSNHLCTWGAPGAPGGSVASWSAPQTWAPPHPGVSIRRGASLQQHQLMNPKIHRVAEPSAASFYLGQRRAIMLTLIHFIGFIDFSNSCFFSKRTLEP